MAFSQVQCLDDSHVNWRSSEAKPEFFYSEEQRLALEALMAKGPEAFYEVLKKENIRNFLSELELRRVLETLETYDPGAELLPRDGDGRAECGGSRSGDRGPAPSLEYWPEKSDRSIPQLDLGWPEAMAYRGVTRATVYMQPPIEFQPHIKEVVRKMIFQAQKVVAVVMDMFTDVDIFKDLLEAGFKRKVAIYIIVEESNLKYFFQMCERAQMHTGHLKNLRVCTIGGTEFFTRSATKFKGTLAQKFMFVDGDKAMCGSYSFTWSAARTDRNVISVLSGQVVEAFDKQFQELYLMSRSVSLKSIPMGPEPEPEPVILPAILPVSPANSMVKKLVNPKYALVKTKSTEQMGSGKASSDKILTEQQRGEAKGKIPPEGQGSGRPAELVEMLPPIHPGLLHLEKANMFDYLPTWVEPDPEPGSEVLGYINIIDPKIKNIQLSQINRIKVCDVSKANAQHRQMLQQKAQEAKNPPSQAPSPTPAPLLTPSQEPPPKPLAAGPMGKLPRSPVNGETLAMLAHSQHLKQLLDAQTGTAGVTPPVPKPRTVHVMDLISKRRGHAEEREASAEEAWKHQPGTNSTDPSLSEGTPRILSPGSHLPLSEAAAAAAATREAASFPVNGVQSSEEEEEDYVTLSEQGSLSGSSPAQSCPPSEAASCSQRRQGRAWPGLLRRTNSDLLPNGELPGLPRLQRKLSEPHVSHGTFASPLGKPQPPGPVLPPEEAGQRRRRRRKSESLEETRCVVGRGRPLHALPDGCVTCPSNAPQGPPGFCCGSRAQVSSGRGKSGSQQRESSEDSQVQRDRTGAKVLPGPTSPLYQIVTSAKNALPSAFSQGGIPGASRATPGHPLPPTPEGQKAPDEMRTPLGIPLSKLSQAKHLRSKALQWSHAKRRPSAVTNHQDQ